MLVHGISKEKPSAFNFGNNAWGCSPDHGFGNVMPVLWGLFLILRILEAAGWLPRLFASYADDLLCLPLILGTILWAHRQVLKKDQSYFLPKFHGLMVLVFFAVYFELILPNWNSQATADPWDLLAYSLGYLFFEIVLNKLGCASENVPGLNSAYS